MGPTSSSPFQLQIWQSKFKPLCPFLKNDCNIIVTSYVICHISALSFSTLNLPCANLSCRNLPIKKRFGIILSNLGDFT